MKRLGFIAGQLISVAIPIGYMIGTHISWMQTSEEKKRMALKHAGFWGGLALTLLSGHLLAMGKFRKQPGLAWLTFLGTSVFPIIGYEGMRRWAKKQFPSQPTLELPAPSTFTPVSAEPSFSEPFAGNPLSDWAMQSNATFLQTPTPSAWPSQSAYPYQVYYPVMLTQQTYWPYFGGANRNRLRV